MFIFLFSILLWTAATTTWSPPSCGECFTQITGAGFYTCNNTCSLTITKSQCLCSDQSPCTPCLPDQTFGGLNEDHLKSLLVSCGWSCALHLGEAAFCANNINCWVQNLGPLCSNCCSCIPDVGQQVCNFCASQGNRKK